MPHRGIGGAPPGVTSAARLNELLDQIRSEFETQLRQSENYEHQSKHPSPSVASRQLSHSLASSTPRYMLTVTVVQTQVNEMQLVREKVYAMEQTHMALKQK